MCDICVLKRESLHLFWSFGVLRHFRDQSDCQRSWLIPSTGHLSSFTMNAMLHLEGNPDYGTLPCLHKWLGILKLRNEYKYHKQKIILKWCVNLHIWTRRKIQTKKLLILHHLQSVFGNRKCIQNNNTSNSITAC
jgi:hypothetical protein